MKAMIQEDLMLFSALAISEKADKIKEKRKSP
jgi:hypothetical protein